MNELFQKRITNEIVDQVAGLLDEQRDELFAAYERAIMESESENPAFPAAIAIKLKPEGATIQVKTRLSYSVRHVADAEAMVSSQPDFLDEAGDDAGKN